MNFAIINENDYFYDQRLSISNLFLNYFHRGNFFGDGLFSPSPFISLRLELLVCVCVFEC